MSFCNTADSSACEEFQSLVSSPADFLESALSCFLYFEILEYLLVANLERVPGRESSSNLLEMRCPITSSIPTIEAPASCGFRVQLAAGRTKFGKSSARCRVHSALPRGGLRSWRNLLSLLLCESTPLRLRRRNHVVQRRGPAATG